MKNLSKKMYGLMIFVIIMTFAVSALATQPKAGEKTKAKVAKVSEKISNTAKDIGKKANQIADTSVRRAVLDEIPVLIIDNWLPIILLILVIILFRRSRRKPVSYNSYAQTKAICKYFKSRIEKMKIIGDYSTEDIKNAMLNIIDMMSKINTLDYEASLYLKTKMSTDSTSDQTLGHNMSTNTTQLCSESANLAKKEECKILKENIHRITNEHGSTEEIRRKIEKLEKLDEAIGDAWTIMKTIHKFDESDFKLPGD